MIARITGTIVEQVEKGVVLETHGVGYFVHTPVTGTIGESMTLYTHLVVREDCQELYGFQTAPEKSLFTTLISVSGVGPKTALHMLTLYPLSQLVGCIKSGDAKAISLVPGIGKKTAEKVIIDLKDKLGEFETSDSSLNSDLVEALLSLGYKEVHIKTIVTDVDSAIPIEKQITLALQLLQKR